MKKIEGGYILQPRKLDASEVMREPPIIRELWMYLLRKVNWKDNKLPRGTGFFRFDDIQNDLCWYVGFRKMKYSKPRITKALRRLCEGNMTATAKATRGIIITVLNYDFYQDPKNYEGNNEDPMKIARRSNGGHTIIKEGEEGKEEKKNTYSVSFLNFYKKYPIKKSKAEAFKSWQKLKKLNQLPELERLLNAIEQQTEEKVLLVKRNKFCPEWKHPSTWLNQKCWEDECEMVELEQKESWRDALKED